MKVCIELNKYNNTEFTNCNKEMAFTKNPSSFYYYGGYSTNQRICWLWLVLVGFGWFLIKLINSQPKSTKSAQPLCI